jgi:hypothetical protein
MALRGSRTRLFDRRYRAQRINWPTSIRLRRQARADRRAGLPLGLRPETTPVLQGLVGRHDDVGQREWTRFLVETEHLAVRLAQVDAELPAARARLEARAGDVARTSVPPTAEQLSRRQAGEHALPETLVRQRRQTAHDQGGRGRPGGARRGAARRRRAGGGAGPAAGRPAEPAGRRTVPGPPLRRPDGPAGRRLPA